MRTHGRGILPVGLCLSFSFLRGTSAQSIDLNETQVSNMILQGINEIQGLGQEFAANFFTDLAPLLILFGDQIVRQYMAQSRDWADHITFAMGPLGIAAALTGAVRMCGHKYLRGVVGRGRETKQMAELDLTSATSEDIYEVWDGESIVRVMGEHTFQEIRLQKEGEKVLIKELFEDMTIATYIPIWKRLCLDRRKRVDIEGGSTAADARRRFRMGPNLSLNAISEDIPSWKKWICVCISVLLQIFVIAWAALVQYKYPAPRFRKDGRMGEFRSYSFPCMAVGTISVMTSMLFCSYVVDKAMERKYWMLKQESSVEAWRPCWIQKWGKADDQTFDSYLIFGRLRNVTKSPRLRDALVTLHPRRQLQHSVSSTSRSPDHPGEREIPTPLVHLTVVACVLGIGGFFVMVAGTRSLHWSVPAAQLGQILFMVLLRAYIRKKMNADDIHVVKLPRGFEMEWLVTRRDELWKKLEDWDNAGRKPRLDDVHFWEPEANKQWSFVTGEKVVRAEEIANERGSITVGPTLTEIDRGKIIEFETLDTFDERGNPKPKDGAQRVLNELKALLHNNQKWGGNASELGNALVKTMVFTLNTLLAPTVMNSMPRAPLKIGLVNSTPGPTPLASVQSWPEGAKGRVWHWPIVMQMGVNSVDGAGNQLQMEEQIVRISLIQRETGGWFVMKEGVEALLTLWLFTLKQRRLKSIKPKKPDHVNMQPAFVRLIGSNTELTRWDIMRWYVDHCGQVYEGKPITIATVDEKRADEIDIEIDGTLGQVMGIEQVDLRSEDELKKGRGGVIQQSETMPWHYFRGRELPQVWYGDWPRSRDGRYKSLATTVGCTLEELCAQEILFRFFFAIGTFMREERGIRLLGNTILSYRNTTTSATSSNFLDTDDTAAVPEKRLKAAKFHNSTLERMALEAYQSKVCGSLEEAYQCIIPAFSQARVLPEVGEVVSSQVTQIFRKLVGKGDWIKACDLYNWVWNSMGCKFPHHSNEDLHAIALYTNFVRKLRHEANTGSHGEPLTKELAAKGEEMLKMITEREFQGRDVVRALKLMLQSLDELDGPIQTRMVGDRLTEAESVPTASRQNSQEESEDRGVLEGLEEGAPEGSEEGAPVGSEEGTEEGVPTGVRPGGSAEGGERLLDLEVELERRRVKEEEGKIFPLLGFTPTHKSTANILGAGAPVVEHLEHLERDANILDIFQRRPLHYAAANPALGISILELLIRKTSGVDQRDINGNTPLHLAASRNNPNFTAALKKLSLEEDHEMRKNTMVDFSATNELKWTPLHFAAYKGHRAMVDELIREGAITNTGDNINRSPLHWAAQGGHLDVVKVLIQKRANAKAVDAYGRSPLHVAASMGHGEVAIELATHGARLEDTDKEGKRALDLVIELLEKTWAEKEQAWTGLDLSEGAKADHQAAFAEDISKRFGPLLDTLLVNEEEKAKGRTALHCAAHRGEAQAVAMLLHLDAKQNASFDAEKRIANQTDYDHETALHVAARGGQLEVVKALILDKHKCNLCVNNISGEDALMVAAKYNKPDVVNVLLGAFHAERMHDICQQVGSSTDPNLNAKPSVDVVPRAENDDNMRMYQYPMHRAAWHGSLDLVVMLAQRGGVDLHKRDRVGMTAIHYAALMGHYRIVEWLLSQSPDLVEALDKDRDTPLHCAASGGRVEVVQLLLERYPDHSESDPKFIDFVNKTNERGETPLHCAAKGLINAGIEKLVLAYKGVTLDTPMWENLDLATVDWQKTLISRICAYFPRERYLNKITARDCESLNQGMRNWQEELVRLLLRIDADRDAPSVSEECERKAVELLLDNKANIEATDKDGETPLHLAARWGRLTIAKILLKRLTLPPGRPWKKANVLAEDIHKDTPLHLAARWGHQEMVRVLYHEQAPLEALNMYHYTPCQVAEDHLQFHISALLKKLISGSGKGHSDSSDCPSSDPEESDRGMRNAGTTANGEASSTSVANHPDRAPSSSQGSASTFKIVVHEESSGKATPCPPTGLDEAPNTLTEFDACGSLAVPAVPHISQKDSGVGTDPLSTQLLAGDEETTPDDNPDLATDLISMLNFRNAGPGVSGNRDSISRSSTLPVEAEYPQQDENTSYTRSFSY